VDLKEPENAGKNRNSRFLKKILTDAEIECVKNAVNPDAALWSFWACKEAAYKVIKKSFPGIAFLPRRWQVFFDKSLSEYSEGTVMVPETGPVFIRLFSNFRYIHCVSSDHRATLDKLICRVERLPQKAINPSLFLRERVKKNLADSFSLKFRDIEIRRKRENGELQPPFVFVEGKKAAIDISFSHDGRFVAYAFSVAGGRIKDSI
jgi:hypothetical protein